MTHCEACETHLCEELVSSLPFRLKRVRLPGGALSPKLDDIAVVQGAIEECPLKKDHDLTVAVATEPLLGA